MSIDEGAIVILGSIHKGHFWGFCFNPLYTFHPLGTCLTVGTVLHWELRVLRFIVVGLSTVMVYAFNSSGGSVLVAILMHSAFNSSSQFIGPFLGATPTRVRPSGELLIGFSFLIVAAVALAMTSGRLGAIGSK
jgi:hypothetical protein